MNNRTTIIVKTKELLQVMIELAEEEMEAIEITIKQENDKKHISFATLECGGKGCCADFDEITEMTAEEIENIP